MANNWYDSALTLKDRNSNSRNDETPKTNKTRPTTKRTLYENLRGTKTKNRKSKTRQSKNFTEDDGYDEDDEEDDEIENEGYSDYAFAENPVESVKVPRVQTSDGPEGCSCFPKRSNKRIPSMLYEGLECKHSGLKGDTHAGVSKFRHNWQEEYEEPDPSGVNIPKTTFFLGYPRPVNLDSDLQYYDDEYDPNEGTRQTERQTNKTQGSKRDVSSKQSKKDKSNKTKTKTPKQSFPYGLLDFMEEEDKEGLPDTIPEGMPITLPRIGISPLPQPSRERERLSARSVTHSLPPLPESPFLSNHQIKTARSEKRPVTEIGEVSDETDDDDHLPTRQTKRSMSVYEKGPRRFKGQYYDPSTKRTRNYEIKPKFRKGLNEWNAYITDNNRQSAMISTLQGRRTTNGNPIYTRDNMSVREDDEYDDDEDDYDDGR